MNYRKHIRKKKKKSNKGNSYKPPQLSTDGSSWPQIIRFCK